MSRIGVMGGTFDPIHYAHIVLATQALEQYSLDEVWFMPSNNPPHKQGKRVSADEHRVKMLELAISGLDMRFVISDYEMKREGMTYSAETFRMLHEERPDDEFFLIVGGDSLMQLENWYHPEQLFKYVTILASTRASIPEDEILRQIRYICDKYNAKIELLSVPSMDISSTDIRLKKSLGLTVSGLIDPKVERYIDDYGLYLDEEIDSLKKILENELKSSRYKHTLSVARTAAELAEAQGEDIREAYYTGLLHDNAKAINYDDQLATADKLGVKLTDMERSKPGALVHSKLGAYFAKERFGVKDENILNAIAYHTTGRPKMSMLEKIIFVADYIEPLRAMETKPSLQVLRTIARVDIDRAVYLELENMIGYLESSGEEIDDFSKKTLEYYKN